MAVCAANPFVVHLALHERTVDVDFILDLPISEVGVFLK